MFDTAIACGTWTVMYLLISQISIPIFMNIVIKRYPCDVPVIIPGMTGMSSELSVYIPFLYRSDVCPM